MTFFYDTYIYPNMPKEVIGLRLYDFIKHMT